MKTVSIIDADGTELVSVKECENGRYEVTMLEGLDHLTVKVRDDKGKKLEFHQMARTNQ